MMLNLDFEEQPSRTSSLLNAHGSCNVGSGSVDGERYACDIGRCVFAKYWNHSNGMHATAPTERDEHRMNGISFEESETQNGGRKTRTLYSTRSSDDVIEDVQCAPIEAEESIKLVYYGTCRMANHNSSLYFDCICGGSECIQWSGYRRQNMTPAQVQQSTAMILRETDICRTSETSMELASAFPHPHTHMIHHITFHLHNDGISEIRLRQKWMRVRRFIHFLCQFHLFRHQKERRRRKCRKINSI